jgi:hypothetical protein
MALKHVLQLDIPETACENVLRVVDASVYAPKHLLPIGCERLDITLPGYTQPVYISENLEENFSLNLTAKDLEIACSDPSKVSLPDGLYTIAYSICPNEKVNVTYYHLRTTCTLNTYYKELCKLRLEKCEPDAEVKQKLSDLRYIKSLIDAAKAKAEICHDTEEGVDMLSYAKSLLSKYASGCCITCK